MPQKVQATVTLEFEGGHQETVTIEGLEVLGQWFGAGVGQGRPVYEVRHPSVNGVYQHHNVGVALLDLLRVAIIDLNPEWCKTPGGSVPRLRQSSSVTHTKDIGPDMDRVAGRLAEGK